MVSIGDVISHYRIVEHLGGGGMGVVYRAKDERLGRLVALKFLPAGMTSDLDAKNRLIREARAASALDHSNICTIYEIDESADGQTFIVMASYAGETLKQKIVSGPLDLATTLKIALQLVDGLRAAHDSGIVHRDLKPANVMVTDRGEVKILDFGLAKVAAASRLTHEGAVLGTLAYMSPEQLRGEDADHRSDIWSVGIIIYEMLTGRLPFRGEYDQIIAYAIANDEPDLTPLTDQTRKIVERTLAKDPEERYQSAGELEGDLLEISSADASVVGNGRFPRWTGALIAATILLALVWFAERRPLTGGTAAFAPRSTLTALSLGQVTTTEDIELYPAFSPGGDSIVFSRETDGFVHLFLRDLTTGKETQLSNHRADDLHAAWSPDGKTLLFVRSNSPSGKLQPSDIFGTYTDGDIWLLDLIVGTERKLIDEAFHPKFSRNGTQIAFDASWSGTRRIWISDRLGRNARPVSYDSSEVVSHIAPTWSPNGKRIAFQNLDWTTYDIKVVDVETQRAWNVTDDPSLDIYPSWSDENDRIYFSSYRGGGLNIWSAVINETDVSQPQQVTTGAGQDIYVHAGRSGRLAFTIMSLNSDIWRLPIEPLTGRPRGNPERLISTTREESRGAWSPDGRAIAFNSDRAGEMNIWIYDLETHAAHQLTTGAGGAYQASWSPDGERLAFFSSRAGNADLWAVDVDSKDLTALTTSPSIDINPAYSPDGKFIAYQSDRGGRREVWLMASDGSDQRALTSSGTEGHFLAWSKTSDRVLFRSPTRVFDGVMSVSVAGGDPKPVVQTSAGYHLSLSPDDRFIVDVSQHKTLWAIPLDGEPYELFSFDDPEVRIDYPVLSPDGRWILFDRSEPRGSDIWTATPEPL